MSTKASNVVITLYSWQSLTSILVLFPVSRIYNGSHVDQDLCTAMCAFDFPNAAGSKCGFVVLVSDVCYLGSLNNETEVLATPVDAADLQLKTCMYRVTRQVGLIRFLSTSNGKLRFSIRS